MLARSDTLTTPTETATRVRTIVAHYGKAPKADPLSACLEILAGRVPDAIAAEFAALDPPWRDHAVASVYATLLPRDRRKKLGAFFTPPPLVKHLLNRAAEFGVDITRHRLRDPAAGGAAFLVPIAREVVRVWRAEGHSDVEIVERLRARISGRELDPGLAQLANKLLQRCLIAEYGLDPDLVSGLTLIVLGDSLGSADPLDTTDHEIGNPPFLRLAARDLPPDAHRFDDINAGRLNLYSAFVRRALDALPPNGIVAYVIPASFLGGPEFQKFRRRIRQLAEVLAIDLVKGRTTAFVDVVQDTCVLVLRRRAEEMPEPDAGSADTRLVTSTGAATNLGQTALPKGDGPWILPGKDVALPSTLADWGYVARVGYLVANRQTDRLHASWQKGRLPLIWAKAIAEHGDFDFDRGAGFKGLGWVEAELSASYVVTRACVVVQRTSARGQRRRIAAAAIPEDFVRKYGGVVGENHVILLVPGPNAAAPELLAAALNRPEVSERFDRMCGSAGIPVRLLETLPLPEHPNPSEN